MTSPLSLSARAAASFSRFGGERQPIVEIAGALADPDRVLDIASRHSYRPVGAFYPGVRAAVSEAVAMPLVAPLLGQLEQHFSLSRPPRYRECFLSLVTQAPGALAPIQRLPHFDGLAPERLAVLLYLDRRERGGTGFYRHRSTGFESVDAARFDAYRSALASEVGEQGLPESAYIAGDTAIFAQVHRARGSFNSLVVYRGNTLHCAALPPDFEPDPAPSSGRLTLNLFLD